MIIRSTHVQCTLYMVEEPISLSFCVSRGHGPILVQINMQLSQAQSYGICTRVNYLTQNHYMWSIINIYNKWKIMNASVLT